MALPVLRDCAMITELVITAAVVRGDLIGFDGTNWVGADANPTAVIRAEWIAMNQSVSGDTISVCKRAVFYDSDAPYTKGVLQFLSSTVGQHTETNPVAADVLVQCVGRALTTSTALIDCEVDHVRVSTTLEDTRAATAANYGSFYVAQGGEELISCAETHRVLGTDGSAVTLDLEKLTGTQALGSGVAMLASTIDLKGTINTVQWRGPTATAADRRLDTGDRVALLDAGTLTSVAHVTLVATFVRNL